MSYKSFLTYVSIFNSLDQGFKTTLGDTGSTKIDRERLSRLYLNFILSILKKHSFLRAYYHGKYDWHETKTCRTRVMVSLTAK
jgi:hypothetical protein